MKKNVVGGVVFLILSFSSALVGAKRNYIEVKRQERFGKLIAHAELAVVMFYEGEEKHSSRKHNQIMPRSYQGMDAARSERLFSGVSQVSKYKEAEVLFLTVNVMRDALSSIASDYGIKKMPTIMLFEDGLPAKKNEKRVLLEGDFSVERLRDFIDASFSGRIEDKIEDKAEARRIRAESWNYGWGWSPYYYWNYPYYGYYGGWYW